MRECKNLQCTCSREEFCAALEGVFQKYGHKRAVTYMRNDGAKDTLTFQQMEAFIHQVKEIFDRVGVVPGDRAAIVSPHSPWAVWMGMALAYAGITMVLIDASLPSEEVEELLEFSQVRAIFTTQRLYQQLSSSLLQRVPCLIMGEGLFVEVCHEHSKRIPVAPATQEGDEDVIAILYSSGTTGQMKGVMVTYESVLKAREVFVRLSGLKDYMSYLLVLPFNHIAGFTGAMTFFLTGCEIGFIEDVNASKLQNGLINFQPHYFAMVPKVFEVMEEKIRGAIKAKGKGAEVLVGTLLKVSKFFRKHFGINLGRILFRGITAQVFGENIFGIGTGASPCKAETAEFFLNLGLEWANLYATTETSVPIVATGILDRYPVGTVGNVNHHPEIQVKIHNPDSNGIGEIMVKSQLMMKGYFRRPDLTADAFENGYFKTGDYGYIDHHGYLYITGRIKESVVLQSGKKVSPTDVDEYYHSRLGAYDIASRGIAVENGSYDELHLFIASPQDGHEEQEGIRAAFEQVSRQAPDMYKLAGIHFVDQIPRTSVGKVKRFCLECQKERLAKSKIPVETCGEDKLIAILKAHTDVPTVCSSSRIREDLGMDSLTMFEVVCDIEKEFQRDISAHVGQLETVADLERLLMNTGDVEKQTESVDISAYPMERTKRDLRRYEQFILLSKLLWKFEVSGTEYIDSQEQYIFCPNHESILDGIWIIGMLGRTFRQRICSVAADYLFREGRHQKGLVIMGAIPVDRTGNPTPALKRALECIKQEGYNLLIHPEGTRSRTGELGEFKLGAAKLSMESGVKIIPVCISGAYEIFPATRKWPRLFDWKRLRRYRVYIDFGPPISPKQRTAEEITEMIRQWVVNRRGEHREYRN